MSPAQVFERRALGFLVPVLGAFAGLELLRLAPMKAAILQDLGVAAGLATLGGLAAAAVATANRRLFLAVFTMLGGSVLMLVGATVQQVGATSYGVFVGAMPVLSLALIASNLGVVLAGWAIGRTPVERALVGVAGLAWLGVVAMAVHTPLWGMLGATGAHLVGLVPELALFFIALSRFSKIERPGPDVATEVGTDPAEWQRAMSGVRLVRHAEAARVGAMALIFLLGFAGANLGSAGWIVLSVGGGALATLVIAVMEAAGLRRFCAVPLVSGARGAAFSAFVLSLIGVGAALTGGVFVAFIFFGDLGPIRAMDLVLADNMARLVTLGAIVPLLWAMRRVAIGLEESGLARRCEVAIGLYCVATGLLVGASRIPPERGAMVVIVLMKLGALGFYVGGFSRLVRTLDALQPFLEGEKERALGEAFD